MTECGKRSGNAASTFNIIHYYNRPGLELVEPHDHKDTDLLSIHVWKLLKKGILLCAKMQPRNFGATVPARDHMLRLRWLQRYHMRVT